MILEQKEGSGLGFLGRGEEGEFLRREPFPKPGTEEVPAEEGTGGKGAALFGKKEAAGRKGPPLRKPGLEKEVYQKEFPADVKFHVPAATGGLPPGRTFRTEPVGPGFTIEPFGFRKGLPELRKEASQTRVLAKPGT